MHTDAVELTEYWKDKINHERLGDKILHDWEKKGKFYKDDADKYLALYKKLSTHNYPTYQVLQLKGYYR